MLRDIKTPFKKNSTGATVFGLLIIVIIVVIIVKIYKATKAAANVTGQAIGNETIAVQLGMSTSRVVYIRSEATRLWDQGVHSYFGIRDYDEEMFIATINEMANTKEVMLLDQLYQQSAGQRLKDAITASFNASDRAKLNQQYLAILQS